MTYFRKLVYIFIAFTILACSGSGNDDKKPNELKTGQFIDAPVSGLQYQTDSGITGMTDANGNFQYLVNERITFFIGDIVLGTVRGSDLVSPLDLAGTGDISNNVVINILRLLQTLDENNDLSDGIQISQQAIDEAQGLTTILVTDDILAFSSNVNLLEYLESVTGQGELVSIADAQAHFQKTLEDAGLGTGIFKVGGDALGINGAVTLQLNQSETLVITDEGDFQFNTDFITGAPYIVEVLSADNNQVCSLLNNTGTISSSNVNTVVVICQPQSNPSNVDVTGNIAGLTDVLQMQTANGLLLLVTVNGAFDFDIPGTDADIYPITIKTQPALRTCVIEPSGAITAANASSATIICDVTSFAVGGALGNLQQGDVLVLQQHVDGQPNDTLIVNGPATSYTFNKGAPINSDVEVSIAEQPAARTCAFDGESVVGNVTADINFIDISCTQNRYPVSGSISNFSDNDILTVRLLVEGTEVDRQSIFSSTQTQFAFNTLVDHGRNYTVEAFFTEPASQTCDISANATGVITGPINDIAISCNIIRFTIQGSSTGLTGNDLLSVTLMNTTTQTVVGTKTVSATSPDFSFVDAIPFGHGYLVTKADPVSKICDISGEFSNPGVEGFPTKTVAISCTPKQFTVSGSVAGIRIPGEFVNLELVVDGAQFDTTQVTGTDVADFAFSNPVVFGSNVQVNIVSNSNTLICGISNNVANPIIANLNNVLVNCNANRHSVTLNISGLQNNDEFFAALLENQQEIESRTVGNGSTSFVQQILDGNDYEVQLQERPGGYNCEISTNLSGTNLTADVTIIIACTLNQYTLSAEVTGLVAGDTVEVLRSVNGVADASPIQLTEANAPGATPAVFPGSAPHGSNVQVTVVTQPAGKTCTGGSVNPILQNSTITVRCSTNIFPVGGTVFGHTSTVVLQNNGGDDLPVQPPGTAPAQYAFPVAEGGDYSISVKTQPTGQFCIVPFNASGTNVTTAISDINISCVNTVTVSIAVDTLGTAESVGVKLTSSGNQNITTATESFGVGTTLFPNFTVPVGDNVQAFIETSPANRNCTFANGDTLLNIQDDAAIAITCPLKQYNLTGSISGLIPDDELVIQSNIDGQTQTPRSLVNGDTSYLMPDQVPHGSTFTLTLAQPNQVSCVFVTTKTPSITGIANGPPEPNDISCTVNTYQVSGTVTGLEGNDSVSLSLDIGGSTADNVTATAPVPAFAFSATVEHGKSFAVLVSDIVSTPEKSCVVSNGSSSSISGDVANVLVSCTPVTYSVSGTINNLSGNDVLQLGLHINQQAGPGTPDETFTGTVNTPTFAFTTQVISGSAVDVLVATQPDGKVCSVANGSVAAISNDITNVVVSCVVKTYKVGGSFSFTPALQSIPNLTLELSFDDPANGVPFGIQESKGMSDVVSTDPFNLKNEIPHGSQYLLDAIPSLGATCTVKPNSSTSVVMDIGPITISCDVATLTIGGAISGLDIDDKDQVVIGFYKNGTATPVGTFKYDGLALSYEFGFLFNPADSYQVRIDTQPDSTNKLCGLFDSSGNILTANSFFAANKNHEVNLNCDFGLKVTMQPDVTNVRQFINDPIQFGMTFIDDPIRGSGSSQTTTLTPQTMDIMQFPSALSVNTTFTVQRAGSPDSHGTLCDLDPSTPEVDLSITGVVGPNGAVISPSCVDRVPIDGLPLFGDCKEYNANNPDIRNVCPEVIVGTKDPAENLRNCAQKFASLNKWKFADQVTVLDCSESGGVFDQGRLVYDLIGLRNFPNLEELYMQGNPLGGGNSFHFYNIPDLPRLSIIDVRGNENLPGVFIEVVFENTDAAAPNCEQITPELLVTPFDPTLLPPKQKALSAGDVAKLSMPNRINPHLCRTQAFPWGQYTGVRINQQPAKFNCTVSKDDPRGGKPMDAFIPTYLFADPHIDRSQIPGQKVTVSCSPL